MQLHTALACVLLVCAMIAAVYHYSHLFFFPFQDNITQEVAVQAARKHTAAVIFFHGLGDTGQKWAKMLKPISVPHVNYVFPTASADRGYRMRSWFSANAEDDEEVGITFASQHAHELVEKEIEAGIPSGRILLGGISQGGALALVAGLAYNKSLAGIVAMSTWLPFQNEFPQRCSAANKNVFIFQTHGDSDSVILPSVGEAAARVLRQFDPNHSFKMYPGLEHWWSPEELNDIKAFINQRLPPI